MKIDHETLKRAAGETEAAEEAASEAAESVATGKGANVARTTDSAIEELTQTIRARKELEEVLQEEKSQGLGDALAEFFGDPQVRSVLAEAWYGPGGPGGDSGPETMESTTRQTPEPATGTMKELKGDTDEPDEPDATDTQEQMTDGGTGQLDSDDVYEILMTAMGNIASQKPDMTISEAMSHADQYEPMVKEELDSILTEFR